MKPPGQLSHLPKMLREVRLAEDPRGMWRVGNRSAWPATSVEVSVTAQVTTSMMQKLGARYYNIHVRARASADFSRLFRPKIDRGNTRVEDK